MKRILVVEDETLVAMMMKIVLTKAGFEVCATAASGEEALEAARETNPEVVLMDITLRGPIDGIETALALAKFCSAPVVYLTGHQDPTLKQRALQTGPLAYLVKPFRIEDLQAVLRAN